MTNTHSALSLTATSLLVVQAQGGDTDALNELYRAYFTPMKRYVLLRLKDPMLSEDLVQNVWLKATGRVKRLQNPELFRSWLFRALRWELLDYLKRVKPVMESPTEPVDADETAALDPLRLMPLLAAMPETQREVVELHYLNGLSVDETALALDIPPGTVKSRLSRARDTLRTTLYEDVDNEN